MALNKEEILSAQDHRVELLKVPEWKGEVYIRVISGFERDALEASIRNPRTGQSTNLDDFRSKFAALVISDENGTRLFNDGDIVKLGEKSSTALDSILEAGMKLNKVTSDDVEDMVKN